MPLSLSLCAPLHLLQEVLCMPAFTDLMLSLPGVRRLCLLSTDLPSFVPFQLRVPKSVLSAVENEVERASDNEKESKIALYQTPLFYEKERSEADECREINCSGWGNGRQTR